MKLYSKILKNLLTVGVGLLIALQSWAQVEEVVPDSTLQSALQQSVDDSVKQKPKQQFLDAPVHYPARDSIIYSYSDNMIKMYGEAKVAFKDIVLEAEYIEMTMDKKEVFASGIEDSAGQIVGNPVFKDGEEEFKASELRYNFGSERAWVVDVVSSQGEGGLLHSHITKRDTIGNLHIKDGKFTTCDADDPHFYFAISKGIMTSSKSVVSGPAYLVVGGIPVVFLGLPFGFFPKQEKKASGIIMPKIGEEVNRGFYLREFGYYFAGTDNFDLTLKGDLYSKGSWKTAVTSSYKNRYKYNGNLGFSYAKNVFGEEGIDNKPGSNDFNVRWSHSQDPKAHPFRSFNANVNFSNSSYDQHNTYGAEQRMTSNKSSSISYSRKFPNNLFNFTAKMGGTQNSQNKTITLNIPSLAFTVGRFYPFKRESRVGKQRWYEKIDMRYSSNMENKIRAFESELFKPGFADKMENGFKHQIPVQAAFKLIPNMTFTPSLKYQGNLYFNYVEKMWDESNDTLLSNRVNQLSYVHTLAPNVNLSYTPRLYGFYTFKNGAKLRHLASPSLSFNYRPDIGFDESKYYDSVQVNENGDEYRYSIFEDGAYPLPSMAGKSGNINFGWGNNFEMKVLDKADSTGQMKKIKIIDDIRLSTSYNIFADSLNLNPLSINARTRILNNMDIKVSGKLDPYAFEADSSGSFVRYHTVNQFEIQKTGNLARLTRASMSLSFSFPMKKNSSGGVDKSGIEGSKDIPPTGNYINNDYWEYNMPWSLRVNYNFNYNKPYVEGVITQSVSFNGSINLTPNWKFGLSSGYDFVDNEITYTKIDVTRDLHCWVMVFNIIPIGQWKSYTFQINVKSNMFKDIKMRKAKSWYDNI